MGLLDFLFAGAVINSVKKARHNDSQQTLHGRVSDYDHGYEDGYDDSCYEHGYHEDCDCHDTYDCGGSTMIVVKMIATGSCLRNSL